MSEATSVFSSTAYPAARRWPRYKADFPVRLIVCKEKRATIFDARGTSLSEGGMALFAGTELRTGDQVAVEFTPAYSAPPIRVDATVCNRTGYNYGVEFLAGSDNQKIRVQEFRRHLSILTANA